MGQFIAIEGGDGSGKATQTELLYNYLTSGLGRSVMKLSFPRYGEPSAYYAEQYLNGRYGEADDVHPDLGSLPYALDRYAASHGIKQFIASHPDGVVLTDRYVGSNVAHQGSKISDTDERRAFYRRIMRTEYDILGIPRPTKNIVLLVPPHISQANVDKKDTRSYTSAKRDIHEADASHLERAKANYEELCELYPDEFIPLNCMDSSGNLRSIEDIQLEIRKIINI